MMALLHPGPEPHPPEIKPDALSLPEVATVPVETIEVAEMTPMIEPIILFMFATLMCVGWTFVKEMRDNHDDYESGKISEGVRNSRHVTLVLIWVSLMVAFVVTAWPVIEPLALRLFG